MRQVIAKYKEIIIIWASREINSLVTLVQAFNNSLVSSISNSPYLTNKGIVILINATKDLRDPPLPPI